MDYEFFATKEAAQDRADRLVGWDDVLVDQIYLGDWEGEGEGPWIVTCEGNKVLRDDGFVR